MSWFGVGDAPRTLRGAGERIAGERLDVKTKARNPLWGFSYPSCLAVAL